MVDLGSPSTRKKKDSDLGSPTTGKEEDVGIVFTSRIRRKKLKRLDSRLSWILCLVSSLWFVSPVNADLVQEQSPTDAYGEVVPTRSPWESRLYLIEGVHYLVNEGDRDMAEELFRRAIFSSSFSSLSSRQVRRAEADEGTKSLDQSRWVVAEAFYFLGKIHYERAVLDAGKEEQGSRIENIAWAKEYLKKAEEYGIVYDRLHPPLLDEINRKYPGIEVPIPELNRDRAKIVIETDRGSYQMNAVKVDPHADITESRFLTNKEFDLECGARYKMKPDIQGGRKSIYRALTVLGIGLTIWLTR